MFSAFYQKIPGVYKQFSNDMYETVSDAAACATACNNGDITPCNSFEYCPGSNLCTLSTHHASDGLAVNNQGTCDFYASELVVTVALLQKLAYAIYKDYFSCKNEKFIRKNDYFNIFAQNVDCEYTLERVPTIYVLDHN